MVGNVAVRHLAADNVGVLCEDTVCFGRNGDVVCYARVVVSVLLVHVEDHPLRTLTSRWESAIDPLQWYTTP